jgi:ferredoxin-NADP reductase
MGAQLEDGWRRRIALLGSAWVPQLWATRGMNGSIGETAMIRSSRKWRSGRIVETVAETPRAKSLVMEVPGWEGHRPGQHVDVRLTVENGYQVRRSYSIASSPVDERVELLVRRTDGGELSSHLIDQLRIGHRVELRGPIGGSHFIWDVDAEGPLLLVAGGCGIAPLMAIIRHRAAVGDDVRTRLLYSSRSPEDIVYGDELDHLAKIDKSLEVFHTLTRAQPPGWTGYRRRIDNELLNKIAWRPEERPLAFVCGPTPLVKTVATGLAELGYAPTRIKRPNTSYRR